MNSLPIGIFDSGVGGLTVLRAVRKRLPDESVIYLGDTARVPYGTKSRATIERYAVEDAAFLVDKGVKMIVVACNTASAMSRERLRQEFNVPLLSVLGPGARMAARVTRADRIGVIATEATIESGAYERAIGESCGERRVEIFSRACPLFVPIVEEGETDSEITRLIAEQYLAPLREQKIDTLLLGCTHYPLLKRVIGETIGAKVILVDSAEATAGETAALLEREGLINQTGEEASYQFYVTDAAKRFHRIAERILGEPLEHLEAVEVWGHDRLERD
ncbi:MAG: glutamate racemase [Acidobacteria bacterium]|nr:glutamate racemase [Acidobacteriota bacterium]